MRWLRGIAFFLAMAPGLAQAHVLEAVDGNSLIRVDPHSDAGLFDWELNGIDHMNRQWFWFRLSVDPSLDTLPLIHEEVHDSDEIHLLYRDEVYFRLQVEVLYTLLGGDPGSGTSLIQESVKIKNLRNQVVDLRWYELTDLNLMDTAGGDSAEFVAPNQVIQTDGHATATVTSLNRNPNRWQIGSPGSILDKMTAGKNLTKKKTPFGPGDVAHAFQYNLRLRKSGHPKDTVEILKEKELVVTTPEPGTLALFGLGLVAPLTWRRRKRAPRS